MSSARPSARSHCRQAAAMGEGGGGGAKALFEFGKVGVGGL